MNVRMNLKFPYRAAACGAIALLATAAARAANPPDHEWTGGATGGNRLLFAADGFANWEPALVAEDLAAGAGRGFRIATRRFGGTGARLGEGAPLAANASPWLGTLVFDDAAGHFPQPLDLVANASMAGARVLRFDAPDTTIIRLEESVTFPVRFGAGRETTGNLGIRLPASGVSTIHVAHPDATLDLSGLFDNVFGYGAVHGGEPTQSLAHARLRKTGAGALDLRTADSQGNRVLGLVIHGGTVIVGKNPDIGWAPVGLMDDHVVLDGGALVFDSPSANSGNTRGFQLGGSGGGIAVTGANHALNGPVSNVPGHSGLLVKSGESMLRLAVDNSYSGGTRIEEGGMRFTTDGSLGAGPVRMEAHTRLAAWTSGLRLPNAIHIAGPHVTLGGDGHSATFAGAIDLLGGHRVVDLGDDAVFSGTVANGTLEIRNPADGTREAGLHGALQADLVAGRGTRIAIAATTSIGTGRTIALNQAILNATAAPLVLTAGARVTGGGMILGDVQLAPTAALSGSADGGLVVLGNITGGGTVENVTRRISPATLDADGNVADPFGVQVFTQDLDVSGWFAGSEETMFRLDLGAPGTSDLVRFEGAMFRFGTEGLDLRQFDFTTHTGFGDGVYTLVTSTEWLCGALGPETRGTLDGRPVWLRTGNDGKSIELRVGAMAEALPFTPGEYYYGRNQYIEYRAGDVPVILVSGHDGLLMPGEIPDRTYGTTVRDTNLHPTTRAIANEFHARTGRRLHVVISELRRTKLDPNREIVEAAQGNIHAEQAWHEYHNHFTRTVREAMEREHGFAITFDMHGHGHEIKRLEIGYLLGSTELNVSDDQLNLPGYAWQSSLRSMMLRNPSLPFSDLVRGPRSFGERFNQVGVPAWPSETHPVIGNAPFFSGGHTTVLHSCIDCNSPVDAIQIETHGAVRSSIAARAQFARDFCDVLQSYLVDFYQYSPGTGAFHSLSGNREATFRGGPPVTLTVTRQGHLAAAETMALAFAGDAVTGADFSVSATSVSFAAGEASKSVTLTPAAAGPAQGDRSLLVRLSPTLAQSTDGLEYPITLGDGVSQTVRLTADMPEVSKNAGVARFTVRRTQGVGTLVVPLGWAGTAVPGGHFQPVAEAVLPVGVTAVTIDVPLFENAEPGDDRTLIATLGDAPSFVRGTPAEAAVRIIDDIRPDGLAIWLADDGLAGNVWRDRSGHGRHATTLPAGLGPQSGPHAPDGGPAVNFEGTSGTAALPRLVADTGGGFTIAFFFRPDGGSLGGTRNLLAYGSRGKPGSIAIRTTSSTALRTELGENVSLLHSGSWGNGAWRHYALTAAPDGVARVFINGAQVAQSTAWRPPLDARQLFWLGWQPERRAAAGFYKGSMRDFRIHQRVLTAAEVAALAAGGETYASWLANHGIVEAAPDRFREYAFGAAPGAGAPRVPDFTMADGAPDLRFTRRTGTSDLRFLIQRSATLGDADWETLATLPPQSAQWTILHPNVSVNDAYGRVRVNDGGMTPNEPPRMFYRIRSDAD